MWLQFVLFALFYPSLYKGLIRGHHRHRRTYGYPSLYKGLIKGIDDLGNILTYPSLYVAFSPQDLIRLRGLPTSNPPSPNGKASLPGLSPCPRRRWSQAASTPPPRLPLWGRWPNAVRSDEVLPGAAEYPSPYKGLIHAQVHHQGREVYPSLYKGLI